MRVVTVLMSSVIDPLRDGHHLVLLMSLHHVPVRSGKHVRLQVTKWSVRGLFEGLLFKCFLVLTEDQ